MSTKKMLIQRILYICLLICLSTQALHSQKNLTIVYRYKLSKYLKDSFAFPLLNPLVSGTIHEPIDFPKKVIAFKKKDSVCETVCIYSVRDTSCGFLLDKFGHEFFILPGDSIQIDILPKSQVAGEGSFKSYTGHDLVYHGRNQYLYSLFDSLWTYRGDPRFEHIYLTETNDNLEKYFNLESKRYNDRIAFIKSYGKRHTIPEHFLQLAEAEVYASYMNELYAPALMEKFTKVDFPQAYVSELKKAKFNNEKLYFTTFLYSSAAYSYFDYTQNNRINFIFNKNKYFGNFYKIAMQECPEHMRNHLLVHLFEWNVKNQINTFDSLLNDFRLICHEPDYLLYLDSVIIQERDRLRNTKQISLADALKCKITDINGKELTIQQTLLSGKVTVIDCWASWCGPCIAQMPYEKKFEKLYANKVNFIYLSFDRNTKDWKNKSHNLKMSKYNFHLLSGFDSTFALHFGIDFIPHYLIFDKSGKLINANMSKPKTPEFAAQLKKSTTL